MKKTSLYENHIKAGGKIIDFGGWALPVQYSGIIEEHRRVRSVAGLFDVSHMGEITVKGADAGTFLQYMVTNDISRLKEYRIIYSHMCYPDGGVVDDLLIYKYGDDDYLVIVNAANTQKDFEWMRKNVKGRVRVQNVSESFAQLALQGPKAETILQKMTGFALNTLPFFYFKPDVEIGGFSVMVSRSGYTGEDGFEIYAPPEHAPKLWEKILEAGRDEGLVPVGLGARDTLRFEAGLPLYGQEISKDITPLEAGLGQFVKLDKDTFIGKDALKKQKENGLKRRLAGFEMTGPGIPRSHFDVQAGGEKHRLCHFRRFFTDFEKEHRPRAGGYEIFGAKHKALYHDPK